MAYDVTVFVLTNSPFFPSSFSANRVDPVRRALVGVFRIVLNDVMSARFSKYFLTMMGDFLTGCTTLVKCLAVVKFNLKFQTTEEASHSKLYPRM